MTRKGLITFCGSLLVAMLMASAYSSGAAETTPTATSKGDGIKWDYLIYVGMNHPYVTYDVQRFVDAIKEQTGGRLQITIRPAGELPYRPEEYVRAVGAGAVQLAQTYSGFISGEIKAGGIGNLPFLIRNGEELDKAWPVISKYMDEELKRYKVGVISYSARMQQHIWGRGTPIQRPADLKGHKVRVSGEEQVELMRKLGANPVTIVTAEVPSALQRGVADAVTTGGLNVLGSRWFEFLDWVYEAKLLLASDYNLVNLDAYNNLPSDIKRTFDKVVKDNQALVLKSFPGELDAQAIKQLVETHKLKRIEPNPQDVQALTDLMRPYWDQWARSRGATAPQALAEVRKILNK